MIVDLPSTTTSLVSKKLIQLREDVGAMALTRVLTLVVPTDEHEVESAVQIAMQASRQHPCRTIVLGAGNARGATRLDAQIRVGGDAGASEVVVLRLFGALGAHGRSVVTPLLLADSPIVAWWPGEPPSDPANDPVGAIARRRITDASRARTRPATTLGRLAAAYAPGDSDLAWSRITLWRGILAAALDQALPTAAVPGGRAALRRPQWARQRPAGPRQRHHRAHPTQRRQRRNVDPAGEPRASARAPSPQRCRMSGRRAAPARP